MPTAVVVYLIVVAAASVVSFAAYGLDKRRAGTGQRRVPERTLHLLAFAGGWPGAILGQRQFRHKTKKVSFRVVFWLVVLAHVGVVVAVGMRPVLSCRARSACRLGSESRRRHAERALHDGGRQFAQPGFDPPPKKASSCFGRRAR